MKEKLVICVLALLLAGPFVVAADDNLAAKSAGNRQVIAETTLREDIISMHKEMERLSVDADRLAAALQSTPHAAATQKIQEHVTSLIQRTMLIEKRMEAESGGVLAASSAGTAKAPAAAHVKP